MPLDIDYAAIIKKADDRRAVLQQIQAELDFAPKHIAAMMEGAQFFAHLESLRKQLDPEGVALLGQYSAAIYNAANWGTIWRSNMQAHASGHVPPPPSVLDILTQK